MLPTQGARGAFRFRDSRLLKWLALAQLIEAIGLLMVNEDNRQAEKWLENALETVRKAGLRAEHVVPQSVCVHLRLQSRVYESALESYPVLAGQALLLPLVNHFLKASLDFLSAESACLDTVKWLQMRSEVADAADGTHALVAKILGQAGGSAWVRGPPRAVFQAAGRPLLSSGGWQSRRPSQTPG